MATFAESYKQKKKAPNKFAERFKASETSKRLRQQNEQFKLKKFAGQEEEGVQRLQQEVVAKTTNKPGITSALFGPIKNVYRDIFQRDKIDKELREKIELNNKRVNELLNEKKINPSKGAEYDIMLAALEKKNKILSEASGSEIKDMNNWQLGARSVSAAANLPIPGAGLTSAGMNVIKTGGKALIGSLMKEGAALGAVSGVSGELEKKDAQLSDVAKAGIVDAIFGSLTNVGVALGLNKIIGGAKGLTNKIKAKLNGDNVSFTPKEKEVLSEAVDKQMLDAAGIDTTPTESDVLSRSLAAIDDDKAIERVIATKVPESDRKVVASVIKNLTNEDDVAKVLDEYSPAVKEKKFLDDVVAAKNEGTIETLIQGRVREEDIQAVARVLKNVEDKETVLKVLSDFSSEKEKTVFRGRDATVDESNAPYRFFSESEDSAKKYADIKKTPDGKAEVVSEKIDSTRFKEVEAKDYLDELENKETIKNYDGVKFRELNGEMAYAKFTKERVPKTKSESPILPSIKKKVSAKNVNTNKPITGTGKLRERGVARKLRDRAVAEGLDELDVPSYRQMNREEKAKKANDLLEKDPEMVMRIANREIEPPAGDPPEAYYLAIENKILNSQNPEEMFADILSLSRSPIIEEATTMGQRNSMWAARMEFSPTKIISNLAKGRGNMKTAKKQIKTVSAKIKNEVKKSFKIKNAQELLDKLTC